MKKLFSLFLISAVLCTALITLSACGQEEAPPKEEENPPREEKVPPKEKEEEAPPEEEEETPPQEEETPPEEDEAPPEENVFTKEATLYFVIECGDRIAAIFPPFLTCRLFETEDNEVFSGVTRPELREKMLSLYRETLIKTSGFKVKVKISYQQIEKIDPFIEDCDCFWKKGNEKLIPEGSISILSIEKI